MFYCIANLQNIAILKAKLMRANEGANETIHNFQWQN